MTEPDGCELHDAAILSGAGESEDLLRLAHSPIGDECQRCSVCRLARVFVELRLAERAGNVFPRDQSAEAAWGKLQAAIASVKLSVRKAT
jgi:hypothetical protein